MKILNAESPWITGETLEPFFQLVSRAQRRVLLLDYDGTLAPFRVERDEAIPYPGVRRAIADLSRSTGTDVVIVSGRSAPEVKRLLACDAPVTYWGSHGWDYLIPGAEEPVSIRLPPETAEALVEAKTRIKSLGLEAQCESKSASIALHWRGTSEAESGRLRTGAMKLWEPLGGSQGKTGLELIDFDGGLEIRARGRTKGSVVEGLLREIDESGKEAAIAYLGDDRTDEDAFEALGNRGLSILVRPELRATAADAWIDPPEGLLSFFDLWKDACGRDKGD